MNPKVQEFLQAKQAEETAKQTEAKQKLLKELKIYDKVVVEKKEDSDEYLYDPTIQEDIFYKYQYPEITDEEYRLLLKYSTEKDLENNGEKGLMVIARVGLWCSIIGTVFIIIAIILLSLSESEDVWDVWGVREIALYGIAAILSALFSYWTIKAFTNISRKSTAIYKLLEEREK